MTHWGARTRQIGTFPVNRENIRVFAGGFGNRLFTQKAGSRNFPSSIQPPGSLRDRALAKNHCRPLVGTDCSIYLHLERIKQNVVAYHTSPLGPWHQICPDRSSLEIEGDPHPLAPLNEVVCGLQDKQEKVLFFIRQWGLAGIGLSRLLFGPA